MTAPDDELMLQALYATGVVYVRDARGLVHEAKRRYTWDGDPVFILYCERDYEFGIEFAMRHSREDRLNCIYCLCRRSL